ncbi:MAG: Gfo/Idh/MocA family oxidoreductase [Clostridia bacterium]|nr:Gfo/Idh/MocA family oxidoreductase [Clostridia bacterium]
MIRIGILGTDGGVNGGHSLNICEILSQRDDVKICGLFGDDSTETKDIAEKFGIDFIAEKPEDLLGKVDAVYVLPRHGDKHKKYAMPFVKEGLPVCIDKPFTCSISDAQELVAEIKKSGSPLCAGTYLKYAPGVKKLKENLPERKIIESGCVCFPISLNSPHGGFHFYSHHVIETMLTIFGTDVRSVTAASTPKCPIAVVNYDEFPVIMQYASNWGSLRAEVYYVLDGYLMEPIEPEGLDEYQCNLFIDAIKTGKGEDPDFFLTAVKVSNAFIQSLEEKREVKID